MASSATARVRSIASRTEFRGRFPAKKGASSSNPVLSNDLSASCSGYRYRMHSTTVVVKGDAMLKRAKAVLVVKLRREMGNLVKRLSRSIRLVVDFEA